MKPDELAAAVAAGFHCVPSRMMIERGDLVVGRYSVLPYYKEAAADIEHVGAQLINSVRQHHYIADMRNWVEDLGDLTPKTWYRLDEFTWDETTGEGPFVLKGQTNSRKDRWKTHMFAATKRDTTDVYDRLLNDGLLGQAGEGHQDIYIRQYVPLVTYARGIADLPITKEFRFFVARGQVLCGAFYWSHWGDTCLDQDPTWKEPDVNEVPLEFVEEAVRRIGDKATFYAIDFAQDTLGRWWVIDLNDGQMSGLSGNLPDRLYSRLASVLGP